MERASAISSLIERAGTDGCTTSTEALDASNEIEKDVASLAAGWKDHDFFFLHYKFTDKAGEDGDFDAKVHYIEQADSAIPALLKLKPNDPQNEKILGPLRLTGFIPVSDREYDDLRAAAKLVGAL